MLNTVLFAAVDLVTIGYWTWIVIKVAIALGAVIFVHELGHFLAAKACGVKVEKFFIGFDIGGYKISWRRGETEYGIGILPLGGYVKMLGQDDDPAHIAEQMQKSQVAAGSADAVEIVGPGGERYLVDRRSYLAKSVPQRMLIISAGVIMNVIFAFIFAVVAFGLGVPYQPSIVSETVPGSPAWVKGLEPGDEIVKIGSRENPTVLELKGQVTLASQQDGILTRVRRASTGQEEEIWLTPDRGRSRLGTIGVMFGAKELTLNESSPVIEGSPAANAVLIRPDSSTLRWGKPELQGGDTIVRLGDSEVKDYRALVAELAKQPDRAISITVRRGNPKARKASEAPAPESQELTFEVGPAPLKRLGLVLKMGPVAAVQIGSPAADAGLKTGDVIEVVDGQTIAETPAAWDTVTLPEYFRKAAVEGRSVRLEVSRSSAAGAQPELHSLTITPKVPSVIHRQLIGRAPMPVPAAGFAYQVENEVVGVVPGGPAENSAIKPNDRLTAVTFVPGPLKDGQAPSATTVSLDGDIPKISWPTILWEIQNAPPGSAFELQFKSSGEEAAKIVKLEAAAAPGQYFPDRGFQFKPPERIRQATSFAEQVQYGKDETIDALLMVYRFLHRLGDEVPFTALGGPVTIAAAAGAHASQGLSSLLIFLTMLSANLAVVNFLPIPLLDGGHMVFLLYEGARGRPANQRFVVAMHMLGFAFIVTLMLFVLGLDVGLIPRNL